MSNLIFEGAGCVPRGELENCRIRTAFHDSEGREIYLEIIGSANPNMKKIKDSDVLGFIDFAFHIDEEDGPTMQRWIRNITKISYTRECILDYVELISGVRFDGMEIVEYNTYHVHDGNGGFICCD